MPELPELQVRSRDDHQLTLEYGGPLPPLLDWLARQPVVDVRMEPLGLGPVYHRYHGSNA